MCIPLPENVSDVSMKFKNKKNKHQIINSLTSNELFMNAVKENQDKVAEGKYEVPMFLDT